MEEIDNFSRELGGALVYFKDGAEVSKVILPVDFPAAPADKLANQSW